MRRFFVLVLLLAITLLAGRALDAGGADYAWSSWGSTSTSFHADGVFDPSLHLNLDLSEEELFAPRRARRRSAHRRSRNFPRARDGEVRFRMADRGYDQVYLVGSFNDWGKVPMRYVEDREVWEIHRELDKGSHLYAFVIEDERGERQRTDPSNPRRSKRGTGRWVSQVELDRSGRIVDTRETQYDFDLLHGLGLSFQRVDGWSFWARPRFESSEPFAPLLRTHLGYGFSSHRWTLQAVLLQPLTHDDRLRLLLTAYDKTDFTIQTGVGTTENTFSSWIFAEDNRDYFRREGVGMGLALGPSERLRATFMFRSDDYGSLDNRTSSNWGWGRDGFLPNPAVDEGTMRSFLLAFRVGSSLNHFALDYEIADDDLASTAFDFSQLTGQLRTRWRLGRAHYIDLRLKAGSNFQGELPIQKRYVLGGIGTVRGHAYQSLLIEDPAAERDSTEPKPFGGQRMALLNAEYAFGVEHNVFLVLFFDSGMAWEDRHAAMDLDDLKSSAGISVQFGESGKLRFDLAKALDSKGADFIFQARFNRMF